MTTKFKTALMYVAYMHKINYGVELTAEQLNDARFIQYVKITAGRHTLTELQDLYRKAVLRKQGVWVPIV